MSDLTKMTVEEMLALDLFKQNLKRTLNELKISREKFCREHRAKAHPIDFLIKKGLMDSVESFIEVYKGVLQKTVDREEYSATKREYIQLVGDTVINQTYIQLEEAENKKK